MSDKTFWAFYCIALIVAELMNKPVIVFELLGTGIVLALLQINQTLQNKK